MLVVQRKLDARGAARRAARAAVRAAAEEPAAHDGRRRRGDRPLPRARHGAARRRLPAGRRRPRSCASPPPTRTCSKCAAPDADALARAAYHLGNRHAPVQVGAGWLRLAADDVLAGDAARARRHGDAACARRSSRRPARTRRATTRIPATRSTRASSTISPRAIAMPADRDRGAAARDAAAAFAVAAAARAPAAAREPDAADRRVQLFAGTRMGRRGRRRFATPRARERGSATCSSRVVAPGEAAVVLAAARRRASARLAAVRDVERVVPRVARDGRAARRDRADGRLAREARCATSSSSTRQPRRCLPSLAPVTLPAAFALAARAFGVPAEPRLTAYLWSWLENQVLAAIKLVPLGQVAGQRLLLALGASDSRGRRDRDDARRRRPVDVRARALRSRARATKRSTRGSFGPDAGAAMKAIR